MRALLWPALVMVALGACSAAGGPSDGGPSAGGPSDGPAQSQRPGPSIALPARVRDAVVADASTRAGVDPADVTIVSAEARTWGDSSLGCPQPGMAYTQATVDGYQVIVSAGGTTYDYRVGAGTTRLCENQSG